MVIPWLTLHGADSAQLTVHHSTMGLLNWFRKVRDCCFRIHADENQNVMYLQKEPEDFGHILAELAQDIQKRETRLNEIRLRERRATLLVTLYTLAGWGAYLGLWYVQVLPQASKHGINSPVDKAIKAFPAILGPLMYVILIMPTPPAYMTASRILFTRRIVQLWYNRKGDAEG